MTCPFCGWKQIGETPSAHEDLQQGYAVGYAEKLNQTTQAIDTGTRKEYQSTQLEILQKHLAAVDQERTAVIEAIDAVKACPDFDKLERAQKALQRIHQRGF